MTELLTTGEMAKRLRVAPSTLRQWAREGVVPAVRVNQKVTRYDPDDVVESLKNRDREAACR